MSISDITIVQYSLRLVPLLLSPCWSEMGIIVECAYHYYIYFITFLRAAEAPKIAHTKIIECKNCQLSNEKSFIKKI